MTTQPYPAGPGPVGAGEGPHPIYMNIEYPFELDDNDRATDYSRAILNIEFTLGDSVLPAQNNLIWTQVAFVDGHVIAFYEKPPPRRGVWVIRGGFDKMTEDHAQFLTMLGSPSDTVDPSDFWVRFHYVVSRPEVLLDIAARQAIESMKDL